MRLGRFVDRRECFTVRGLVSSPPASRSKVVGRRRRGARARVVCLERGSKGGLGARERVTVERGKGIMVRSLCSVIVTNGV